MLRVLTDGIEWNYSKADSESAEGKLETQEWPQPEVNLVGRGRKLSSSGDVFYCSPCDPPRDYHLYRTGGKVTQPPPEQLLGGSGEGGQRWGQVRSIALPIPLAQKHYMRRSKLNHATHCKSTHLLCPLPSCYSDVPSYWFQPLEVVASSRAPN